MRPVETFRGFSVRQPHGPTLTEAAVAATLLAGIVVAGFCILLQLAGAAA